MTKNRCNFYKPFLHYSINIPLNNPIYNFLIDLRTRSVGIDRRGAGFFFESILNFLIILFNFSLNIRTSVTNSSGRGYDFKWA